MTPAIGACVTREARALAEGDRVLCDTFGVHTVETITRLAAGAIRVDLSEAVVLIAGPTHTLTVLEDLAA